MKSLINVIKNKIVRSNYNLKTMKYIIEQFVINKMELESACILADDLNISTFKKSLTDESDLQKLEYVEKLVGWFYECPNESQVLLGLKYLKELCNKISKKKTEYIFLINKLYKKLEKDINNYQLLLDKLKKYNDSTYIDENDLLLIEQAILDEDIDEDLINEYKIIAKNNALIYMEQQGILESITNSSLDENLFDAMDIDRESSKSSVDILFDRVDKFLSDNLSLSMIDISIQQVNEIKACFEELLSIKDSITEEIEEEAEVFKNEIEIINSHDVFLVAITLLLIENIENKNKSNIVNILNMYANSELGRQYYSLDRKILEEKRNKLNSIIKEHFDESEYTKFSSSYIGMSTEQIEQILGIKKLKELEVMKYIYDNCLNIDDLSLDKIEELICELQFRIAECTIVSKNMIEEETVEEQNIGLNLDDVLNYVVFLNPDRVIQNIIDIMREYSDLKLSTFAAALSKLFLIPQVEMYSHDSCKPIMESERKINPYDIREERAGDIRICFKAITTCNNHVIYEVLSFAYGSCGDKKKSDNLKASLKEYGDHIKEYEDFENIFKEGNISDISKQIEIGLNFYNELLQREKVNKLGE